MAQFQIDDTNGNSVLVDLAFNLNPFGTNTWRTAGGDPDVLGIDQGNWTSDGVQNTLILRDAANLEIGSFSINVAVSLTDPFANLSVNDSGDGALFRGGDISWTLVSK